MVTETELLYLVVAVLLTLLIHLILSNVGGRRNRMSH